jgi:putative ABC transport system substrate-binding protein
MTMRRRLLAGGLAAALFFPVITGAQDSKVPKIGVILQGGPSWYAVVEGLRDGLNDLGLAEGKQYVLEVRETKGDLKAVENAAREFERAKISLIYTAATSVSLAAQKATEKTPIVFIAGTNPVTVKLVDSIRAPGGRLTGVHVRATDLVGKRLEMLRDIVPDLRRVVTFYNPNNRSAIIAAKEAREAAQILGLELIERKVGSIDELQKALQAYKSGEADAFIAVSDAMIDSQIQSVIDMSRTKKLPTMVYELVAVEQGGLVSYSTDFRDAGHLSAKYVQQILSGKSPAQLPVEGIDKLKFVINLKTAKQIGLNIPERILLRADKVIE